MEKEKLKPEQALAEALEFTEDDLAANRQGVLSESQQRYFTLRRKLNLIQLIAYVVAGILVCIFTFVMDRENSVEVTLLVGVFVLLFGGMGSVATIENCNLSLRLNRVDAATGRIHLDIVQKVPGVASYELWLEKQRFRPNQARFLIFKNGDPYTIYYEPITNRMLSAEWLRDTTGADNDDQQSEKRRHFYA